MGSNIQGSKVKVEESEMSSPWTPPEESRDRLTWAICLPLRASAYYTMPNCRLEKWSRWFLVSFFMSMLWISVFSYVMVWMITIIGSYNNLPFLIATHLFHERKTYELRRHVIRACRLGVFQPATNSVV